ncbi:unnamed protein product [Mesocestoides corti]|uniref:Poly [ADP-ribose] polymerase n=1 Tax=Mesocestoides corti TaxID=53468 RepID=A0A158QT05_MESCO|nr:unnamed protein product [Mesocestoides corti]
MMLHDLRISGLSKLKAQEKFDLLDAVANVRPPSKKRGAEDSENSENVAPSKKSKLSKTTDDSTKEALRKQSEKLWHLRSKLEAEVSKNALIGLLEFNDQHVPTGLASLLDAVVDGMLFGALLPCPECKSGALTYENGSYRCKGMASQWARCTYSTMEPKRRAFKVPKQYHDVELLRTYKYKPRVRLFAGDAATGGGQFDKKAPLAGLHFLLDRGPFHNDLTQRDLAASIKKLGGSLLATVRPWKCLRVWEHRLQIICLTVLFFFTFQVTRGGVFVTTPVEDTETKLAARARGLAMRPLCSTYLDKLAKAKTSAEVQQLIDQNPMAAAWRDADSSAVSESSDSTATRQGEIEREMVKMRVKGGAVVDPDSGLVDRASVARDDEGRPLSAVLGMVDLVKGYNSYYRLQVLRSDENPQKHWLFRSWGRIGTDIGGNKVEQFPSVHGALSLFKDLYVEKTGNVWGTTRQDFKKVPFRFYPLEMDYGEDDEVGKKLEVVHHVESKLHVRLQALMNFLFDVASMNRALLEFEIDVRKMPLGKISRVQIQEAYSVLSDLSSLVEDHVKSSRPIEGSDKSRLIGDTTRFYTLIPHDFGLKSPPLLDSLDVIKTKSRMLEDLLELEVAYSLMKTGDSSVNPLDEQYEKLKNKIEPLERDSEAFKRIVEYLRTTHAATHSNYTLEVVDIFDVERVGEAERYERFRSLDNRMMLWHGSRRTNWPGILAQGLRIAPPEAPSTGYMFGKGVYFADMASKSANYCFASRDSSRGCMLLCEVALGNMQACFAANDSRLRKGFNSRKGVGATCPSSETYYTDPTSGVVYPIGKPVTSADVKSDLLYNEYIVYDPGQIKQKYLVWLDFKFNY